MADKHVNPVDFPEVSAPGTPGSGFQRVYGKPDGFMYAKDANGNERQLGGDEYKTYVQSRLENLITNGSGLLDNNDNFAGFTFNPVERPGGGGSFEAATTGTVTKKTDELIPVDVNRTYRLSHTIKGLEGSGWNFYFGFECFDADKLPIRAYDVLHYTNTETTLALPLNTGDTTITLTDTGENWYVGGTGHARNIAFYPYVNNQGYAYPDYTYSRLAFNSNGWWDVGGVSGNVITLKAPWTGVEYPAGTAVANAYSGGSFNYAVAVNDPVPTEWTEQAAFIQGLAPNGTAPTNNFRQGTAFIKLLWLFGYGGGTGTSRVAIGNVGLEVVPDHFLRSDISDTFDGDLLTVNNDLYVGGDLSAKAQIFLNPTTYATSGVITTNTVNAYTTSGAITLTLPPAAGNHGRIIWVKKCSNDLNPLTLATQGGTIDDDATAVIRFYRTAVSFISDGANWKIF